MHVTADPSGPDLSGSGPAERERLSGQPVELSLPVQDDLLVLVRFTVSAVASRAGFDIEEIEDLRLAVDELCLLVLQGRRTGRLLLAMSAVPHQIDVWCHYDGADEPREDGALADGDDVGLSARILDALVDEHGPEPRDGRPGAHLCKRRVRSDG
jgi:serine/threonine-protein kinase RsbW